MSRELESFIQIGQVVSAKYRVDRILGAGGMGIVVAATHLQLDQLVALKFIQPEMMTNPEVVSRFEREARAAVRLKSEHVGRIIDVGRLDAGSPYIVMEYLEGQDLSELLQQTGAIAVSIACDFIAQACDSIGEAHSLGIIHRDLKPGNLFLATTSHGRQIIKVLDFGISKTQVVGNDVNMTRTQAVMGSPGYMSPEQMRSAKNVDSRSDIWSLGIILYELVTGRVPFHADTFTALCLKVAIEPPPPLPALPATFPPGFEAVVKKALEKDSALRYQSAVELAQALSPFGAGQTRERTHRLSISPAALQASSPHHLAAVASSPSTLHGAASQVCTDVSRNSRTMWKWILAGIGLSAAAAVSVNVTRSRPAQREVVTEPAAPQQQESTLRSARSAPLPSPSEWQRQEPAPSQPSPPPSQRLQPATPQPSPPGSQSPLYMPPLSPPASPPRPAARQPELPASTVDATASALAHETITNLSKATAGGAKSKPVRVDAHKRRVIEEKPTDDGAAIKPPIDPFSSPD